LGAVLHDVNGVGQQFSDRQKSAAGAMCTIVFRLKRSYCCGCGTFRKHHFSSVKLRVFYYDGVAAAAAILVALAVGFAHPQFGLELFNTLHGIAGAHIVGNFQVQIGSKMRIEYGLRDASVRKMLWRLRLFSSVDEAVGALQRVEDCGET
jgi:hypothetical protein